MSSKFGEIRQWTTELAALERLKKVPKVVLDGILFILTGNDDIQESLDEF